MYLTGRLSKWCGIHWESDYGFVNGGSTKRIISRQQQSFPNLTFCGQISSGIMQIFALGYDAKAFCKLQRAANLLVTVAKPQIMNCRAVTFFPPFLANQHALNNILST